MPPNQIFFPTLLLVFYSLADDFSSKINQNFFFLFFFFSFKSNLRRINCTVMEVKYCRLNSKTLILAAHFLSFLLLLPHFKLEKKVSYVLTHTVLRSHNTHQHFSHSVASSTAAEPAPHAFLMSQSAENVALLDTT